MFVTTADPKLEPPVVTVNTVLSLLALDYPAGKLTCYVSDDGCSAVTCYALREAAEFAKLWVPFCKKHGVGVRAPFVYFSSAAAVAAADDAEFLRAWTFMKVKLLATVNSFLQSVTSTAVHTYAPVSDRVVACRTSTRSWCAGSRTPKRTLWSGAATTASSWALTAGTTRP
jgi:hypothetical protein